MSLLEIHGLSLRFGGVRALQDVEMEVDGGTIHGLIGPNGAGKTTLLNCIGRVIRPQEGRIRFDGVDLLDRATHELAGLGIARTFQNLALMNERSVLDNVMVGLPEQSRGFDMSAFLPTYGRAAKERASRARAHDALALLELDGHAEKPVRGLPYGHRKSIEIARALCASPRMLMLDEPTAGLNSAEMDRPAQVVTRLRSELDLTILLITHHIEFLLQVADRVTVLDLGRVLADGAPQIVQTDPEVRAAYLGVDE
ncbi:MAG: ABC transporter ATP-binding protein [Gemmatimonadales bacterium]|nr:ABC transporter ATP-binding protein [Gemmatimonadales bacterium]